MLSDRDVTLRALGESDLDKFVQWANDPEVAGPGSLRPHRPMDRGRALKAIEAGNSDSALIQYGIEVREELIGFVMLQNISWTNRTAEVGVIIGDKSKWGAGYATQAVSLLCGYAFNQLNLNYLTATILSTNVRALRLNEKLGFKSEGVLRQASFKNGSYCDVIIRGLLRDEWLSQP